MVTLRDIQEARARLRFDPYDLSQIQVWHESSAIGYRLEAQVLGHPAGP